MYPALYFLHHTIMEIKLRSEFELFLNQVTTQSRLLLSSYFIAPSFQIRSDVDFYAVMTRPNDKMFSSFVNCVVMSTIYASAEGIGKNNSFAMPTLTIFGNDMLWSLKDGIYARGSYEEIYSANFHNIEIEDRGRNDINTGQEPQLLDEPGLGI